MNTWPFRLTALSLLCAAMAPLQLLRGATFEDRMQEARTAVFAKRSDGPEAFFSELESQARALLKDFPDRDEPYQMLLAVASNAQPDKARPLLKEIVDKGGDAEKRAAGGQLAKLDALGKPLDITFTALDGRQVDLSAMKGKVVLVDFWATWCGPCVQEVPNVKATYEKLHGKGFEIVGISFDQEKSALESFVKEHGLAWPQYFDGKGWKNNIGRQYGISAIPAMWLVDKEGKLIDMNARADLEGKVSKLLE